MTDAPIMLVHAVPYIRLYKGKTFVVKVGGRVVSRPETLSALIEDICILQQVGVRVVLVHGGGPQASALSRRLGVEPTMIDGRRVTDAQALEVAKMVYAGTLNTDILAAFRAHETKAVGLSGVDAGLILAKKRAPLPIDYGLVGDIEGVDPAALAVLLDAGITPVVACLGADEGGQVLNVNADSVAQAVAVALKAEKLVVVTDTEGLLRDVDNPASLVSYCDVEEVLKLKAEGRLSGGMLPKAQACLSALKGGVRRTHVINGMKPGALQREIFTNAGCGTMIVEKRERQSYQQAELEAVPA